MKIPLIIETKRNFRLDDIYVFPDIDIVSKEGSTFDNYISSHKLLDSDYKTCIVDGESQVGKSSLLSMLYVKLHEQGVYPLLLKGSDIKDVLMQVVL